MLGSDGDALLMPTDPTGPHRDLAILASKNLSLLQRIPSISNISKMLPTSLSGTPQLALPKAGHKVGETI